MATGNERKGPAGQIFNRRNGVLADITALWRYAYINSDDEAALRYAINIREDQLNPRGNAVRIAPPSLSSAFKAMNGQALLYAPRGERQPGYFGIAAVAGVHPDLRFLKASWLELAQPTYFSRPVTLEDIYDSGAVNDSPFHAYAKTVRLVSPFEAERVLELAEITTPSSRGFSENVEIVGGEMAVSEVLAKRKLSLKRVRRSIVRYQMLRAYGPKCAFTHEFHTSLDGLRFAVQVGHLLPLWLQGPDIIQNAVPMSGQVNWLWDEGVFTMRRDGTPIISSKASASSRALLGKYQRIAFPKDIRHWPKAEYLEAHADLVFEKVGRLDPTPI